MTLFSWKKAGQEDADVRYSTGIVGRRWALVIHWCYLAIEHQCQHRHHIERRDDWSYGAGYYQIGLHWDFKVKFASTYYDGNHRALWLGPLCITWMS
jgi:hypothetical protein